MERMKSDMFRIAARRITEIILEEIGSSVDRRHRDLIENTIYLVFDRGPMPKPIFFMAMAGCLAILVRELRSRVSPHFLDKIRERVNTDALIAEMLDGFWNLDGDTDPGMAP
jgi:hypothetical protein